MPLVPPSSVWAWRRDAAGAACWAPSPRSNKFGCSMCSIGGSPEQRKRKNSATACCTHHDVIVALQCRPPASLAAHRNTALGPQPASSLLLITLAMALRNGGGRGGLGWLKRSRAAAASRQLGVPAGPRARLAAAHRRQPNQQPSPQPKQANNSPVHIHGGHTLAQPVALHHGGRHCPHLQHTRRQAEGIVNYAHRKAAALHL